MANISTRASLCRFALLLNSNCLVLRTGKVRRGIFIRAFKLKIALFMVIKGKGGELSDDVF